MSNVALISIFCPDRTGLVAAITGKLFDLGANLADTNYVVLGRGGEFSAVCELPDTVELASVKSGLEELGELADADVTVKPFPFDPAHGLSGEVTHRVTVTGGDQPGLIVRLCETFVQFRANIVSLNAGQTSGPTVYTIRLAVWIPPENRDACLATVANTAGNLQLHCHWEAVVPSASDPQAFTE